MYRTIQGLLITLAASQLLACGVSHIGDYVPKRRAYESPVEMAGGDLTTSNGSLFNTAHNGTYLFSDHRAMRMGDIVTVRINERADAKRGATTELGRNSETKLNFDVLFGLIKAAQQATGGNLFEAGSGTEFKGTGQTTRSERLEATVPAVVMQVLPNGNLFIEGHRVVLVNNEEHHFYISGVVRPVDIETDNSVTSSLIADAEIEFTGRGVITEKQDPPWLQRGLDLVKPF
ncbi:MAG: flagellar basal body L-ring protein FlgH [Myxococcota bacterium]|jgi:flagellar L-ring protein precursor FlgH|nr:flagellar basal body L-ring protein FlgH [Myxococcota bacterium]